MDKVFPDNFFEDVFTEEESDHFYASFFNALVHNWGLTGQSNPNFDDLPFGNIGAVQLKKSNVKTCKTTADVIYYVDAK